MPTAHRYFLRTMGVLAIALGAGCATVAEAPSDTRIQGSWQLDTASSDHATVLIDKAVAVQEARRRRAPSHRPPPSGDGAESSGSAGASSGSDTADADANEFDLDDVDSSGRRRAPRIDIRGMKQRLQQSLNVPAQLLIQVQPDQVQITADGLPGRDYTPGEKFSRIDAIGLASVDSKWSGDAFVLRIRYDYQGTRTERYAVDPRDGTLIATLDVKDPVAGKLALRSVYRRVSAPTHTPPPSTPARTQ